MLFSICNDYFILFCYFVILLFYSYIIQGKFKKSNKKTRALSNAGSLGEIVLLYQDLFRFKFRFGDKDRNKPFPVFNPSSLCFKFQLLKEPGFDSGYQNLVFFLFRMKSHVAKCTHFCLRIYRL